MMFFFKKYKFYLYVFIILGCLVMAIFTGKAICVIKNSDIIAHSAPRKYMKISKLVWNAYTYYYILRYDAQWKQFIKQFTVDNPGISPQSISVVADYAGFLIIFKDGEIKKLSALKMFPGNVLFRSSVKLDVDITPDMFPEKLIIVTGKEKGESYTVSGRNIPPFRKPPFGEDVSLE